MKFELHVHATDKHTGLKSHILCTCVQFNSMCSKLEGIFKHIGLTPWTHAWSTMAFKFQKFKKVSETHETLVDVMSCHQDDVVKKLACLTKLWTHPSQTGATH